MDDWNTPSEFALSQAEFRDYTAARFGKPAVTVSTKEGLARTIESSAGSPDWFLLLSKSAVEAVKSFDPSFTIEFNEGDELSGKIVYKSQTVGGTEFKSSINCLLFETPSEEIGFIAKVEDIRFDATKAGPSLHTLNGDWFASSGPVPVFSLSQRGQFIFNDLNGRGFLMAKPATLLIFVPFVAPVIPDDAG
jgi:hypothetical protein